MAAARRRRRREEIVDALLVCEEDDSDLDMLLTDTFSTGRNLENTPVNLDQFSDDECFEFFRFAKPDLTRLHDGLSLPEKIVGYNGTAATSMEALLILLRRLAYPNRWCDLVTFFQRDEPELSIIFNTIVEHIYEEFGHLLTSLNLVWLDLVTFAEAVHNKGATLDNCWGFIDGTARSISRPTSGQGVVFSGHKRTHCLKFQSIQAPNGLIAHMFGPIEGSRHDAFMLGESEVLPKLEQLQNDGPMMCVYGDPAYPLRPELMGPFKGAHLTPQQQIFNRSMSEVRVCVEWGFAKIITLFAFLDFKKNQKLYLQPVAMYFLVATILTNCHTCLYGSETSTFFDLQPPTLEMYLSNEQVL
ncbi:uncharacterized protein [Ptychodera flava]|uniref:uncharacterized protein n=1 Tax=Ptychodera flava TaxID=63121 RepID=UPI00396A10F9